MLAARASACVRPTSVGSRDPKCRSKRAIANIAHRAPRTRVVVRAGLEEDFPEDTPSYDAGPFVIPEGASKLASYTDPTVWKLMQATIREAEVEQILPAKAKLLSENDGWTLIDVRPYPDYCSGHAWGAKNAQLYAPMEIDSLMKAAKQAATLALFPERALDKYAAVECNELFLDEMQDACEWGSKVILYCGTGGVIGTPDVNFADGAQTASLIAAHELTERGWGSENIKHMAGGLGMWEDIEGFDLGEVPDEE
jgi:rhodanese-related sulfurtransferase